MITHGFPFVLHVSVPAELNLVIFAECRKKIAFGCVDCVRGEVKSVAPKPDPVGDNGFRFCIKEDSAVLASAGSVIEF